jgi:hypothetical protein
LPIRTNTAAASGAAEAEAWVLLAAFGYVLFLLWGTGFTVDDYTRILEGLTRRIADNWWPPIDVSVPVLHFVHGLPAYVIGDKLWAYDLLKAGYAGAGVYFASRFFGVFCPPRRALMLAFLFVFLPLHDAATYWFTGLYLIISFTCYLYAYALGVDGRLGLSVVFALIGSFSSYGSPPVAFGLAVLALLQERRNLAIALFVPNLVYSAYYLTTSLIMKIGVNRVGQLSATALLKQILRQVVTFLDASFGPSAWEKIYYSIASLDRVGWAIGLLTAFALAGYVATEKRSVADRSLIVAAGVILVGSFAMFALTDGYPQVAFTLTDRDMVYGGFFLVCLLATLRIPGLLEGGIIVALVLAIAGVSEHWKQWNSEIDKVAANIRTQKDIHSLSAGTLLYVSGHECSHLGPYCHIVLFSGNGMVQDFFDVLSGGHSPLRLAAFNRGLVFEDGELLDQKGETTPVKDGIWLYDSERNILERVAAADLTKRIQSQPEEIRRWTQRASRAWLSDRILQFAPYLRYPRLGS